MGEVEDLLRKQREEEESAEEGDKLLDLVNGIHSLQEDALIESLITNEALEGISSSIVNLNKSFEGGIKSLVASLASFKPMENFVDETPLLPIGASNAITQLEPSDEAIKMTDILTLEQETSLKQLDSLQSIDKQLSEQARLAKASTFSEEGGVAGVGTDPKAKPEEGGILGTLAGFFKTKIPPLPKGIGKVFTGLKVIGKVLGKALIVVTALLAFFDFFQGFSDEEELQRITGKSKEDLSGVERTFSGIANAIEGLSFGLLDAAEIFESTKGIQEGLQKAIDFLFDPDTGVFKEITLGFIKVVDVFSTGSIIDGLIEGVKFFTTLPLQFIQGAAKKIAEFFDPSGVIQGQIDGVLDAFVEGDFLGGIGLAFKELFFLPSTIATLVTEKLAEFTFVSDIIEEFKNFAQIPINFIKEITSKATDVILDFLPDSVKGFIGKRAEQAEKLGSFVSDTASSAASSVSDFFSFGSKENENVADQKGQPAGIVAQKGQVAGAVVQSNADFVTEGNSSIRDTSPVQSGFLKAIAVPPESSASPISAPTDNRSVELSKERLEDNNITIQAPAPQTVVVQAPEAKQAKVIRRSSVDDIGMSVIGAGMLDG